MALKTYNPVTPSTRQLVLVDRSALYKGKPVKGLTEGLTKSGGRNNYGRVTARFIGGGHKRSYRIIDFKRRKFDVQATVERIEYDPNRTAFIALVKYEDGELNYIIAPQRLAPGDKIIAGQSVDVVGNLVRLVHSQNSGGLFGLLRGQALPFGLISLVVVALIVIYHGRTGSSRYMSITLGLLLGGALGNLIDRLRLNYVVDFVDAGIGSLRWYTFNVADAGISFAVLLLLAASIWPKVVHGATVDA